MRFFAIGAVLGGFLVAAVRLAFHGDSFATALLVGVCSPLLALVVAALVPTKPAPSKVDPAKIARLERELGVGLRERAEESADERGYAGEVRERWIAACMADGEREVPGRPARNIVVDTEAPTTVATFHGAPTFGHKIEGP